MFWRTLSTKLGLNIPELFIPIKYVDLTVFQREIHKDCGFKN